MLKKFFHALLIGLGAGVFSLLLWYGRARVIVDIENAIWPFRVKVLARPSAETSKIKLIVADRSSLEWLEKQGEGGELSWPWPREVYGPILSFLKRGGAKVVAFDMIFDQPSRAGVDDDEAFADAIENGPPFVGVISLSEYKHQGTPDWPADMSLKGFYPENLPESVGAMSAQARTEIISEFARFPHPKLIQHMTILGNVNQKTSGTIDRVNLFRVFDGRAVPSLALASYLATEDVKSSIHSDRLVVGDRFIPLDRNKASILHFRGPRGTHRKYSAASIIQSEMRIQEGEEPLVNPAEFKDSYVLFIPTATATNDLKVTPVGDRYPGGEIHATALDNILANDFIRETPVWLAVFATLFLSVVSACATFSSAKTWLTAAAFLALFLPRGIGAVAYEAGLWWPETAQTLAVLLSVAGVVVLKYATEGRERRFIKQAFGHYLSPLVIQRIVADPSLLSLGGERRELTILFTDLQGFTSISEKLDPNQLTSLLNDYLSDMTEIILDEGGTLDKYEGDAIIAFWNAPLDQPDHALRAVRAVLKCQQKLAERRIEFEKRAGAPMRMRVGLHTGEVVVGNMGSRGRFDYTVLGDAANLAARLEGANKALGTYTMVSEFTWSQTKGEIEGRELGLLRVVGRQEPVRVFEPLGMAGKADTEMIRLFEQGLACCRSGEWAEAHKIFGQLPDDPAAITYAERCSKLMAVKHTEWDSVWNLTSK